jgi:hypothetical protein
MTVSKQYLISLRRPGTPPSSPMYPPPFVKRAPGTFFAFLPAKTPLFWQKTCFFTPRPSKYISGKSRFLRFCRQGGVLDYFLRGQKTRFLPPSLPDLPPPSLPALPPPSPPSLPPLPPSLPPLPPSLLVKGYIIRNL